MMSDKERGALRVTGCVCLGLILMLDFGVSGLSAGFIAMSAYWIGL